MEMHHKASHRRGGSLHLVNSYQIQSIPDERLRGIILGKDEHDVAFREACLNEIVRRASGANHIRETGITANDKSDSVVCPWCFTHTPKPKTVYSGQCRECSGCFTLTDDGLTKRSVWK